MWHKGPIGEVRQGPLAGPIDPLAAEQLRGPSGAANEEQREDLQRHLNSSTKGTCCRYNMNHVICNTIYVYIIYIYIMYYYV